VRDAVAPDYDARLLEFVRQRGSALSARAALHTAAA
jgi:hypothetical protein